jgi:Asp-tRNA(Asn)/Glu-tRNA(Gln) amidotransferase A subunit family amidase
MSDQDLCYMSALEALRRFRDKSLSPVELMSAVIARAEATEPHINSITFRHFDEAMDQARKAEAKYARGAKVRPLEGLAVAVKDESYIKGKPTSNGSLILKDYVADHTSPVNERVLRAGGIVHARTATPEFSCSGVCWSRLWGVSRNPWNTAYTPGGSSGGAGAALAAGSTTIATGSDIGGSIRIPASVNGIVGFKPPYGRVPEEPPFNLDFYSHNGPMARDVRDTILLQNVMAGPHPKDIATVRPRLRLPTEMKPISGWKIAVSMDLGIFEVDEEVQRNTRAALDVFRGLGATVEEVDLGWPKEALSAALHYLEHIFGAVIGSVLEESADDMTIYARAFAERGIDSRASDFVKSLEMAGRMYETLGPILEKYNVLICPTMALPAVEAEFDQTKDQPIINGKPVNPFLGWGMTTPFNMLSRCPVLSVPSGRASNGIPTGIQIVGRTYSDGDVFRAALAFEDAVGGWLRSAKDRPVI